MSRPAKVGCWVRRKELPKRGPSIFSGATPTIARHPSISKYRRPDPNHHDAGACDGAVRRSSPRTRGHTAAANIHLSGGPFIESTLSIRLPGWGTCSRLTAVDFPPTRVFSAPAPVLEARFFFQVTRIYQSKSKVKQRFFLSTGTDHPRNCGKVRLNSGDKAGARDVLWNHPR